MIQRQTKVHIIDNSGGRVGRTIQLLGGFQKRTSQIGDFVVVTIQKKKGTKVHRGDLRRGFILHTKKGNRRKDGSFLRFGSNAVILVTNQNKMIGSKVFGGCSKYLDGRRRMKPLTLSSSLI
jgi:large subunit ribosomal protein L14